MTSTHLIAGHSTCGCSEDLQYLELSPQHVGAVTFTQGITKVNLVSPYMTALFQEGLKVSI